MGFWSRLVGSDRRAAARTAKSQDRGAHDATSHGANVHGATSHGAKAHDASSQHGKSSSAQQHHARENAPSIADVAPANVLRQVKRLELRTRRLVDSHFAGEYRSLFKGQGMEFSEVREYQAGDEVRAIDWNVTARMGRPFVKRYVEERELTVMLVVDMSGSSRFGTRAKFKHEMAAEIASVLALAATRTNDRAGLLLFTDRVEHVLPARKGRKHALRIIRDLIVAKPQGQGTIISNATDYLQRMLPHRSVVFVLSDFVAADVERSLNRLSQRHDVIAVTLQDPVESMLPDIGYAWFEDPETGERVVVNTSDEIVRESFSKNIAAAQAVRRNMFAKRGIDEIIANTETGYIESLMSFFRMRARRAHGAVRTAPRSAKHGGDKVDLGGAA